MVFILQGERMEIMKKIEELNLKPETVAILNAGVSVQDATKNRGLKNNIMAQIGAWLNESLVLAAAVEGVSRDELDNTLSALFVKDAK